MPFFVMTIMITPSCVSSWFVSSWKSTAILDTDAKVDSSGEMALLRAAVFQYSMNVNLGGRRRRRRGAGGA